MSKQIPSFDPNSVGWAHAVLFQALIVQLIESDVLTVENGQRVFDLAMQRASKARAEAPDAERLISHIHDNLKWDDMYRWSADRKKKKPRNENGK